MDAGRIENIFFLACLVGAGALFLYLVYPYLGSLVLAGAFAVVFGPLYRKILLYVNKRATLASLLTVLVVLLIVLAPLCLLAFQVFSEARGVYIQIANNGVEEFLNSVFAFLREYGGSQLSRFYPDAAFSLRNVATFVIERFVAPAFSGAAQFFMNAFLTLLAFYYFLKDGDRLRGLFFQISPLPEHYDQEILAKIKETVDSVVKGTLLIAIAQGFLSGMGFWIFGVPNPAFWGSLAVVSALIPLIGTTLVALPIVIFLIVTGSFAAALGLAIWAIFLVGLIDNLLRPYLLRHRTSVHPLLVLLSVLGGLEVFGPLGFLLGPVVLSLFAALAEMYPHLILKSKQHPQ